MRNRQGSRFAALATGVVATVTTVAAALGTYGCGGGNSDGGEHPYVQILSDRTVRVRNVIQAWELPGSPLEESVIPSVDSVQPASGRAGTRVTIKGRNFNLYSSKPLAVVLGTQKLTNVKVVDGETLTATIPDEDFCGPATIIVATPFGTNSGGVAGQSKSPGDQFDYLCPAQ